ncbi:MAG: outer membrane lipoprotein-sorting protein [Cyclobacteriaceae bacterium]|nr:outer membrane lipoprotein-sorting protein [Cyclobacteriaceae bacterium]
MKVILPICLTGLFIFTIFSRLSAQSEDPREILRKVEDNMRGDAAYTELSMITERPRYKREISMKSWSLGDDFSLILVTGPARDKGTAFLKRGKEIWNYMPGIDRTVKMPPSMMSQAWMGSDFTNDDLVRGTSTVDDYTHKLLRTEKIDDHDCFVLELIPKPDAPIVYDKVIYWVSKVYFLPVKVENFDEFGELASVLYFRDIKNMGGRNIPAIMEMVPATRSGHKTIITTNKADYKINLNESWFSLQNLTNVK